MEKIIKVTKKREMITNIIEDSNRPLSAEEIYSIISKQTDINLSTVYRTLNLLTCSKVILKLASDDGINYYELRNHEHKHAVVCDMCHESKQIDICPLKTLESNISTDTGYKLTSHKIEFRGICPTCVNKSTD